jgi:hypothetical protein
MIEVEEMKSRLTRFLPIEGRILVKSIDPQPRARCFNPLQRDRAETALSAISQSIFSDFRRGREAMVSKSFRSRYITSEVNDSSSISRQHPLGRGSVDLNDILPNIGRNLISLQYISSISIQKAIDEIVEHCPNLQILDISLIELNEDTKDAAEDLIKRGLKKLAKLKVNHKSVRLGTDWKGYRRLELVDNY